MPPFTLETPDTMAAKMRPKLPYKAEEPNTRMDDPSYQIPTSLAINTDLAPTVEVSIESPHHVKRRMDSPPQNNLEDQKSSQRVQ